MGKPVERYSVDVDRQKKSAIQHFSLIVDLFKSKRIDYWIEYGTMLGAVREKGFIPWDSEFDIGIWNRDYVLYKSDLLEKFDEFGFHVNTSSKDRIKLVHRELLIGAYTIDIHTYHLKGEIAFVSFNRRKLSALERFYAFLRNFDKREVRVYPISSMIKTILKSGNQIPEHFFFTKFNYANKISYIIEYNDKVIEEVTPSPSLFQYLLKKIFSFLVMKLPASLVSYLVDFFKNILKSENRQYTKVQAIPSRFYLNLTEYLFEDTYLSGPAKGVEYVECIYGDEWQIGKPNWINSQNSINKNIESIE